MTSSSLCPRCGTPHDIAEGAPPVDCPCGAWLHACHVDIPTFDRWTPDAKPGTRRALYWAPAVRPEK